jgi:hypothetical protein
VWVDVTSLIDVSTGLPLQTRTHKKIRKAQLIEVEVGDDRYWWRRRRRGRPARTGERELPGDTHDLQSVLALLRSWRPAVRPEALVHVLLDRRLWRVGLKFRGREMLDTAIGRRPAVRVDGAAQRLTADLRPSRAEPSPFSLWIADEGHRVPLRFVIETRDGELGAELVGHEPGRRRDRPRRSAVAGGPPAGASRSCPSIAQVREAALRDAAEAERRRDRQGERQPRELPLKLFGR